MCKDVRFKYDKMLNEKINLGPGSYEYFEEYKLDPKNPERL